ncbi:MAG: beta-Ala-His dipeptidase, partial [Flavobacteriaceae bacterium]|nr:beta-Ala-His dipeptidase [Flavobacteriaceae bacterium]
MFIEGDWVKAEGTTLGADNGLGVSAIMAILESNDIPHPAIEALFTVDEETGMTGAKGLDTEMLDGKILLNLDTEEDDEIGVGCAGGVDVTAIREYKVEEVPTNTAAYTIKIKGLSGGHSGMDINKGLGNANKIMARLLLDSFVNFGLRISEIDGGGLRNAIPRESRTWVVVDKITEDAFCMEMAQLAQTMQTEYRTTDPKLKIEISSIESVSGVMEIGVQEGLIKALCAAHNGVYRMSPEIEDLVETSNNIARVKVNNGFISVDCLTRSSVESTKLDLANNLRATFELIGCTIEFNSDYPGWEPNMDSEILSILKETYIEMFDDEPHIAACHAGLECGLIGQHYPELDMISFGPTILGAHSPDERACISSVRKFWDFLQEILKRIPKK